MEGYCGVAHSHVCNGGHGCAGEDCACPCHFDNEAQGADNATVHVDGRPAGVDWWPPL